MQRETDKRHLTAGGRRLLAPALMALAAAAFMAFATPSVAQDEGANVWRRGGCATCHGGLGEGGEGGEEPEGPSLRQSTLDRDIFRETAACGRGDMPFNLEGAWQAVSCYGVPAGEPAPEGFNAGAELSAEDLDVLVDFLFEYVVGVERITRAACAAFYGGDLRSPVCAQFPVR